MTALSSTTPDFEWGHSDATLMRLSVSNHSSRHNLSRLFRQAVNAVIAVTLAVQLSGCESVGDILSSPIGASQEQPGSTSGGLEERTYSIFFDQGDHFKKLVEAGRYEHASALFSKYEDTFFASNADKYKVELDRAAKGLETLFAPQFEASRIALMNQKPSIESRTWASGRAAVEAAKGMLEKFSPHQALAKGARRSPAKEQLASALKENTLEWERLAPHAFEKCDLGMQFFNAYPSVRGSNIEFLNSEFSRIEGRISEGGKDAVLRFRSVYSGELKAEAQSPTSVSARLARLFVDQALKSSNDPNKLKAAIGVIAEAKHNNISIDEVPGLSLAFVEVTSQTLLKEGQVQFPVAIEVDLPLKISKTTLDAALTTDRGSYDYVIAFEVNLARNSQRIQKREQESSRFLAGTKQVPNPEYEQARMGVYEAQNAYASNQNQYCNGMACFAKAIAGIAFAASLNTRKQQFAATPMFLTENIYQDYKYSLSDVAATKSVTAHYYIVDVKNNRYFKSSFDISEEKKFRLAYNVHEKDPESFAILSRYSAEKDLKQFDEQNIMIHLSDVIEQFASRPMEHNPFVSLTALREDLLKDKNKALAAYRDQAKNQVATKKDDSRFESVVVILNPRGGLGAGFFVAPDLVVTNYHVVDGIQFVEMKMHNGLETFGKVVRSDVRLDLALIRTQSRGRPATFHSGSIQLGSTVEAIGHPRGLEFSITRGIVSALRKRPGPFGVGSQEVLFVQTDTPINPGNSGGPLFLDGAVIAVNNNKLVGRAVEGIGFSIHYTEVEAFLSGDK